MAGPPLLLLERGSLQEADRVWTGEFVGFHQLAPRQEQSCRSHLRVYEFLKRAQSRMEMNYHRWPEGTRCSGLLPTRRALLLYHPSVTICLQLYADTNESSNEKKKKEYERQHTLQLLPCWSFSSPSLALHDLMFTVLSSCNISWI